MIIEVNVVADSLALGRNQAFALADLMYRGRQRCVGLDVVASNNDGVVSFNSDYRFEVPE